MDLLTQLQERIELLVQRYTALQAENQTLKATVVSQQQTIESLHARADGLSQQLDDRRLAAALTPDEKAPLREHLDGVIRDIDKILAAIHA